MANTKSPVSSRLVRAQERLERAVERLATVVDARLHSDGAGSAALADDLASARARSASLAETAETVSERLDATIGRLRRVLGD